mmetsp:Transcript_45097/g.59791  ORF Transcript_45097/g.59791 Transcript_45097/m.59791 type:complete len:123 (+) Transcript_45097:576-944(+)
MLCLEVFTPARLAFQVDGELLEVVNLARYYSRLPNLPLHLYVFWYGLESLIEEVQGALQVINTVLALLTFLIKLDEGDGEEPALLPIALIGHVSLLCKSYSLRLIPLLHEVVLGKSEAQLRV